MSLEDLSISVTFLMDRYYGGDWPPSPGRLYQAMVAGVMTCGNSEHAARVEPALRWLENQNPPVIRACPAAEQTTYRIAVPNNDSDVVARDWAAGRSGDPAALRTMKQVAPRELNREGPHVEYRWRVHAAEAEEMLPSLRTAAHCLHTLGWGVDIAFAEVRGGVEGDLYEPALFGDFQEVPMNGTLDDLQSTYKRFAARASGKGVDTHTRPSMFRKQAYRRADQIYRPAVSFMLTQPNSDRTKAVPWEHCMKVAAWLRSAAAKRLHNEYDPAFIESYIQGHTAKDRQDHRLSYVPLPTLFGEHGDGQIRRALIIEPGGAPGEVVRMLRLKLTGATVTDKNNDDVCSLAPPPADDWVMKRYLSPAGSPLWRTVTPVVLHGHNTARRGEISLAKTERLLLRAFEMTGYSEETIESFAFQAGPWWPGTKHASAMLVPEHLDGYPRIHVQVRFKRPMRGPMIAGIGRHYGIGLFAESRE